MPTFRLNKLVRDKLPSIYESLGQKPTLRFLANDEHKTALIDKIIEEAKELQASITTTTRDDTIGEIADVQQALDDLKALEGITDKEVKHKQAEKSAKSGGFADGVFIETLALPHDDTWVKYYRQNPERYEEIDDENNAN